MINVQKTIEDWFEEEVAADPQDWSDLHWWCFIFDSKEVMPSILTWIPGPDGKVVSSFPGLSLRDSNGMVLDEESVREGMRVTLDALTRKWNESYPDNPRHPKLVLPASQE